MLGLLSYHKVNFIIRYDNQSYYKSAAFAFLGRRWIDHANFARQFDVFVMLDWDTILYDIIYDNLKGILGGRRSGDGYLLICWGEFRPALGGDLECLLGGVLDGIMMLEGSIYDYLDLSKMPKLRNAVRSIISLNISLTPSPERAETSQQGTSNLSLYYLSTLFLSTALSD